MNEVKFFKNSFYFLIIFLIILNKFIFRGLIFYERMNNEFRILIKNFKFRKI